MRGRLLANCYSRRLFDARLPQAAGMPARRSAHRIRLNRTLVETSPIGTPRFEPGCAGGRVLSAFISSLRTVDLRRKILFTLGIVILYRVGASLPSPGRQLPQRAEVHRAGQRRRLGADLLADQPVLRRRAAAAGGVRGRHHALHHREHHRAAARRGHPALRAAAQRRPGRPGQDDAVHPLPGGRAGPPAGHQHRGAGRQRRAAAGLPARHHPRTSRSSPWSSSCS